MEGNIITADHEGIRFEGRMDDSNPKEPVFVYPYSSAEIVFEGTSVSVILANRALYFESWLGYFLDGKEYKLRLSADGKRHTILLSEGLSPGKHTLTLFKRMDDCHEFTFYGFVLSEGGKLLEPPKPPRRRMEFYGDSVTAGEVAEALEYVGRADPEHQGEYNNAYYSYGAIAGRMLHARVRLIAQGGIALLDGTGYFHRYAQGNADGESERYPNGIGMESAYDKIRFEPELGEQKSWDFQRYVPHVVVAAIGQNDAWPRDFMREDFFGEAAEEWRERYKQWILKLHSIYPKAYIILTTTILEHSPKWDRAIGKVCAEINDPRIVHFLYQENGRGTKGHIRIPEAEKMALELAAFIGGLPGDVFED